MFPRRSPAVPRQAECGSPDGRVRPTTVGATLGGPMDAILSSLGAALRGRFTIERELGRGGMAIVYLARDERHDRRVALKVLRPELAATLPGERFLREIRLAATLDHPHIVPLHDSGEAAGLLFYVMPFVEGESLRARIERDRQLPLADALHIAREVADALQYAHERNVVHRDIKPENILLGGGHARVADFGIARAISEAGGIRLTERGIAIGTPEYMCPEQWEATDYLDGRADVYALGCVLYEMLAGSPPFSGPTAQAVMKAHLVDTPPALTAKRPGLPAAVASAVMRAIAKSPNDRFASAEAFATALPVRTTDGVAPDDDRPPGSRRTLVLSAIGATALLLAATASVGQWGRPRDESGEQPASVAVPPLRNLGDSSDAYFADGLAQEITAALTRVRGIAPRPYVSVASLARSEPDPLALGKRLGVDYVLAATLRRQGERLRVTSELIRVNDGSAVWAPQSFDGTDADIFRMQDSITMRLVRELDGRVARNAISPRGRGQSNPEAYALYLQASSIHGVSAPGSRKRIELLERAVAIDPEYADAWAALAGAYAGSRQYTGEAPSQLTMKIGQAIDRALALDSTNIAARMLRLDYEPDFSTRLREWEKILEMAPSTAWAHQLYAQLMSVIADDDSAYKETLRAIALDPRESHFMMFLGHLHMRSGRLDAADTAFRHALRLNPEHWVVHIMLGRLALVRRQGELAIAHTRRARQLQGGGDPFSLALLGLTYRTLGRESEARAVLDSVLALSRRQYVQHAWLAWARFGAGDRAGALDELERSLNAGENDFGLALDELYPPLRDEARHRQLVERVGFAPYWKGRRDKLRTPYR